MDNNNLNLNSKESKNYIKPKKPKKPLVITLVSVVSVAVIGGGAFFVVGNREKPAETTASAAETIFRICWQTLRCA